MGVSEGGLRGKEWGEQFYKEVLLPCSENLRKGLTGHLGDEVSHWRFGFRHRKIGG